MTPSGPKPRAQSLEPKAQAGARSVEQVPGGHRIRATPVPIPNTEVKPDTADGTVGATPWESRSLPGVFSEKSRFEQSERLFCCHLVRARQRRNLETPPASNEVLRHNQVAADIVPTWSEPSWHVILVPHPHPHFSSLIPHPSSFIPNSHSSIRILIPYSLFLAFVFDCVLIFIRI